MNVIISKMDNILHNTAINDRYQLRELLGRGSFGQVYNAIDTKSDTTVAIKVEEKK